MNLLIVDDEYFIVKSIVRDLDFDALGITSVSTAFSVQQAQDIFAEKKIDILLTDVEMPRQSGLELISWAHEHGYNPVSLILTGHPQFDYAQRAVKLHCFGYILKPASPDVLTEELKSAVEAVRLNQVQAEIPVPESSFMISVKKCITTNI
ncbi:MAG: response regulator [Clostridia bacterium]|nr:response regulator [Clostridia bacterium]